MFIYFLFLFFFFFIIFYLFFFFNDTATTEIYTLSLHDALPISKRRCRADYQPALSGDQPPPRSEEHTSELQSHVNLVCRLLLEKKKKQQQTCLLNKTKNTFRSSYSTTLPM